MIDVSRAADQDAVLLVDQRRDAWHQIGRATHRAVHDGSRAARANPEEAFSVDVEQLAQVRRDCTLADGGMPSPRDVSHSGSGACRLLVRTRGIVIFYPPDQPRAERDDKTPVFRRLPRRS